MRNLRWLTVVLDKQVFYTMYTAKHPCIAGALNSHLFYHIISKCPGISFLTEKKKHRKEFKDTFVAQDLFGRLAVIINFLKAAKRVGI